MKELTELEALQAKYDALKTEYHLIRATLRLCLSDEQNVANPGSVEKIRALAHDRDTSDGAIRIQASQIENLMAERDAARGQYNEVVDALCSKLWLGRERHSSVVGLAKRLHNSQRTLHALELEDVALSAGYCIRKSGHDGPCNGLPRNDCPQGEKS